MEAMTAAHRSLPFGTRVEVTVLETGRRTRVRINDRGPFVADRVLDVSRAAARRLGFLTDGTARVRIMVTEVPARCWEVQVGAYGDRRNVEEARRRIRRAGEPARTERTPDGLTRVLAGPYETERRARAARERVGGFVRACPITADASAGRPRSGPPIELWRRTPAPGSFGPSREPPRGAARPGAGPGDLPIAGGASSDTSGGSG